MPGNPCRGASSAPGWWVGALPHSGCVGMLLGLGILLPPTSELTSRAGEDLVPLMTTWSPFQHACISTPTITLLPVCYVACFQPTSNPQCIDGDIRHFLVWPIISLKSLSYFENFIFGHNIFLSSWFSIKVVQFKIIANSN